MIKRILLAGALSVVGTVPAWAQYPQGGLLGGMFQQVNDFARMNREAEIEAQLDRIELQNKLIRWKIENPYGEAYLYGNGNVHLEPDHYLYYDRP